MYAYFARRLVFVCVIECYSVLCGDAIFPFRFVFIRMFILRVEYIRIKVYTEYLVFVYFIFFDGPGGYVKVVFVLRFEADIAVARADESLVI